MFLTDHTERVRVHTYTQTRYYIYVLSYIYTFIFSMYLCIHTYICKLKYSTEIIHVWLVLWRKEQGAIIKNGRQDQGSSLWGSDFK